MNAPLGTWSLPWESSCSEPVFGVAGPLTCGCCCYSDRCSFSCGPEAAAQIEDWVRRQRTDTTGCVGIEPEKQNKTKN